MRRFFFFKSSTTTSEEISTTPPLLNKKAKDQNILEGSKTPDDSVSKSRSRYPNGEDLSSSCLRRSLSFSSPATYQNLEESDLGFSHHYSGSPSNFQRTHHFSSECPIHGHPATPETQKLSRDEIEKSDEFKDFDFSESNGFLHSTYISPVPLKCGTSRITNLLNRNKVLDVYIEGEQATNTTILLENDSNSCETVAVFGLGKPPRTRSTEPFSPNSFRESLRSCSFRESRDFSLSHRLQDMESETNTTVEDIYEDTCDDVRAFSSNHSVPEGRDVDEMLLRQIREVEERLALFSEEELDLEKARAEGVTIRSLLKMIQNMREERQILALELSVQIKSRLAERCAAREQWSRSRLELDTRTRRLEKERIEMQAGLERELDRRSSEWSAKLTKYQTEEERLRDRVRELAEQNVSLQREVSSLKSREVRFSEIESHMEQVQRENHELKGLSEELGHLKASYREKEEETKGLQKSVVRLQKTCSEQERTINGLRQERKQMESSNKLEMEITRLASVEQRLRRELETCRSEIELLRRENVSFLQRLQENGNGNGIGLVRFEQELRARVECLQTQGFALLEECNRLNTELLQHVKSNKWNGSSQNLEGYYVINYTLRNESTRKGMVNLKRSLESVLSVLDEKSSLDSSELRQQKEQKSEDELQMNWKAEVLINKVLREKLWSQELERDQLQAELASLVRGHELLRSEIQRLQDEISCLTYKSKDLEIQIIKKDEIISQLEEETKETVKELAATRSTLKTVTEERDIASQELVHTRKSNLLLNEDINFLRKRVECLDEDLLLKEGQICILKDSIDKPLKDYCFN